METIFGVLVWMILFSLALLVLGIILTLLTYGIGLWVDATRDEVRKWKR